MNINPILKFADSIGCELDTSESSSIGSYVFDTTDGTKKIIINDELPNYQFITILAHEIGHAIQSPKEFTLPKKNSKISEKKAFIYEVELDAWVKAEKLIGILFPNINEAFWRYFYDFKYKCLESYENIELFNIITKYPNYFKLLNEFHRGVEPFNFNNLLKKNLEVSI